MEKIQASMCFDVVFLSKNISTCLFTHFPVFSPFSAHSYPSLHHNGKGSYGKYNVSVLFSSINAN